MMTCKHSRAASHRWARRSHRHRRAVAALAVAVVALAWCAVSASAKVVHPYLFSFDGTETPAESMGPRGVAVDNSGSASKNDVYVTDATHKVVDKFTASGKFICEITGAGEATSSKAECDESAPGVPGDSFASPVEDAVGGSGELYVADLSHFAVDQFSPAGAFVAPQISPVHVPYAVAVNASNEVLIATYSTKAVDKYDPATNTLSTFANSTPAGALGATSGVAVNDDAASPAFGDVYAVDLQHKVIDVYNEKAEFQCEITGAPSATAPAEECAVVEKVTSEGVPAEAFESMQRADVDPKTGDLYVTDGDNVDEFAANGAFIGQIAMPASTDRPFSVAVSKFTGDLYAASPSGGAVYVYGAGVIVPDVTLNTEAEALTQTSADLSGNVDPAGGGEVTTCGFEYETNEEFNANPSSNRYAGAQVASCTPATLTGPSEVTSTLGGLSESTPYHFRLMAENADHVPAYSESEGTFETTGRPVIAKETATAVTREGATFEGEVNTKGYETEYHFEYGLCNGGECASSGYEASMPAPDATLANSPAPVSVSEEVSGLSVGAVYHYRLVAKNQAGTVDGAEERLETVPVAALEDAYAVARATSVSLTATVNSLGTTTTCQVEYVGEADYEASGYSDAVTLPCTPEEVSAAGGRQQVTASIAGLMADAAYHFRYVLSNGYGRRDTADQQFATFGIASVGFSLTDREGADYTQAGGHPYELTQSIALNTAPYLTYQSPDGNLKDVRVHLPAGLVGNPSAVPACARYAAERFACSPASQVGLMTITMAETESPTDPELEVVTRPLYNVVPPKGVPAQFSARFNNFANAFIDAKVRTGEGYAISAESLHITTLANIVAVTVKMWGVPGDPAHDGERYCRNPNAGQSYLVPECEEGRSGLPLTPFLTNPTSCTGPLSSSVQVDSYQYPGLPPAEKTAEAPGMTGCEKLQFTPTIAVAPESASADSPSGVEVHLHVPQEESAEHFAEANLKDATVTLPEGITINPAAASGLTGCPLSGAEGINLDGPKPAGCPNASKIGTVELKTPLFPDRPFDGSIYVAQQGNAGAAYGANPFGSLLAIYIGIDEPETGVVVKLAGHVTVNGTTGQLVTRFDENPQLPFEDLRLRFFGGSRAALATPRLCGTYETTTSLVPWSGQPAAEPSGRFAIMSGPGGSACAAPGFAPAFTAGTSANQAGSFASFTMALGRKDGEQRLGNVAMTMPPGLAGMLSNVPLCEEPDARTGSCPAASQIGHVAVTAGVGSTPVRLPQAGRREDPVYLTGPYEGAPFGLAIVVHPEAGPFNLADGAGSAHETPVVVRAKIEVDPRTAQISVVSGPMPTILQGIPVDVQTIKVTVDRAGFMFNPTSCEPTSLAGTIGSAEGASSAVSSRFQAAGCQGLPFKPDFKALTHSHHSRKKGAYLHVVIQKKEGEANIKSVFVKLPKKLVADDKTLKQACAEEQFAKDPEGCPEASKVGTAKVYTPVLPVPLEGPAIYVSHGGEAYPDLDLVLHGDGVAIDLTGNTHINGKTNVTSSDFKAAPDVPFSRFDLVLPQKANPALGGNGNLCYRTIVKKKRVRVRRHGKWTHRVKKVRHKVRRQLMMPTTITGQNGAVIKQATKIAVTGCGGKHKAKGARNHKHHSHGHKGKHQKGKKH